MSRINLNNYEAFWLDFMEGTLSDEDRTEFMVFAQEHPELEIDLSEELISLSDDDAKTLSETEKTKLKEIAELEVLIVLSQDGELSESGRLKELSTKHPGKYDSLKSEYNQSTLIPEKITFPQKRDLKQPIVIPMYWRVAVAATIVGFIALVFPWDANNPTESIGETIEIEEPVQPLQQLTPNYAISSKEFDFSSSYSENNSISIVGNNDLIANSSTDTASTILPDDNENNDIKEIEMNIALDTTGLAPENIDQIVLDKDSISVSPIVIDQEENIAQEAPSKNMTVPEFLAEKVLNVKKKEEEPLLASILDQKTNLDVAYNETESPNKKVTQFKVGKFEFYKSSKK